VLNFDKGGGKKKGRSYLGRKAARTSGKGGREKTLLARGGKLFTFKRGKRKTPSPRKGRKKPSTLPEKPQNPRCGEKRGGKGPARLGGEKRKCHL